MGQTLLENARLFDGRSADCPEGMSVLVEEGIIREVRSADPGGERLSDRRRR